MKIVFDVDDILWPLNLVICEKHNIIYGNINEFKIPNNKLLTEEEKSLLLQQYGDVELFRSLQFFPSAKQIRGLIDKGMDISIYSHSMSDDIANLKRERLHNELDIPYDRIVCTVISIGEADKKKELPENLDFFVDDSPYNIAKSHARENLIIKTPWNINQNAMQIMGEKKYKYFDDLGEVLDYIQS